MNKMFLLLANFKIKIYGNNYQWVKYVPREIFNTHHVNKKNLCYYLLIIIDVLSLIQ